MNRIYWQSKFLELIVFLSPSVCVICLDTPPPPLHDGISSLMRRQYNHNIDDLISDYDPDFSEEFAWEISGLFEGDIMESNDTDSNNRNVILDKNRYWPTAVVPFYISDDFNPSERSLLHRAMQEIERVSCIKFRNFQNDDESYITIRGSNPGCWSYVGRRSGGQVVNLQTTGCLSHGTIVHELLHTLGFNHQQSAVDRDRYVKIHWENILPKQFSNFKSHTPREVTDFRVGYDYHSIMHYEEYAFSKNGMKTITANSGDTGLGRKSSMSPKDIKKLNIMYGCR